MLQPVDTAYISWYIYV